MKAFILAGGEGKRLRPLTYAIPKPLLPVGEKPVLEILIENLKKQGFGMIFGPGTPTAEIADYIEANVEGS